MDDFGILYEDWKDELRRMTAALRTDALDGDVQRLRIKRGLVLTLQQCKQVKQASDELEASMRRIYDLMDGGLPARMDKRKGLTR
jgi:hypothetical protein